MSKSRTPGSADGRTEPAKRPARQDVDAFLNKVRSLGPAAQTEQRGRLIFALDATMSRQPLWDTACRLQAEMFRETSAIGGLDVQLIYYRGLAECRASRWVSEARQLGSLMERIDCRGGHTQIGKILAHARRETEQRRVQALVFVGDAMEEPIDDLCAAAGQLGLLGVPSFVFQEGHDAIAEQAFREIARLSHGAYCRFDANSAHELAELLRAVAAYAAGGLRALADLKARHNSGAVKLLAQLEIAMPTIVFGILVLVLVLWGLNAYSKADPKVLAQIMRPAGGIVALAVAGFLFFRGHLELAVPLGMFGLGLLGWGPFAASGWFQRTRKTPGQVSRVRSAFVEMELDHDTGAMRGRILAGRHEGTSLDALDLTTLLGLLPEIDPDSRALLEAYLDRREPDWRDRVQGDAGAGQGQPERRGPMTEEEAYQVLGVRAGASAEEIGRAHRALMKKLHPDQGGSNYLAAQINQAKEVLLRRHR